MILDSSISNKMLLSPDIPFPWFISFITVASCPALRSSQIIPSNLTLPSRCRIDKCQRCPAAGNNIPQAPALLQNAITASTVRFDLGSDLFDLFLGEGFHVHAERYCLIYQILLWGKRWKHAPVECLSQCTDGRERPCNVTVCKLFARVFTCACLRYVSSL